MLCTRIVFFVKQSRFFANQRRKTLFSSQLFSFITYSNVIIRIFLKRFFFLKKVLLRLFSLSINKAAQTKGNLEPNRNFTIIYGNIIAIAFNERKSEINLNSSITLFGRHRRWIVIKNELFLWPTRIQRIFLPFQRLWILCLFCFVFVVCSLFLQQQFEKFYWTIQSAQKSSSTIREKCGWIICSFEIYSLYYARAHAFAVLIDRDNDDKIHSNCFMCVDLFTIRLFSCVRCCRWAVWTTTTENWTISSIDEWIVYGLVANLTYHNFNADKNGLLRYFIKSKWMFFFFFFLFINFFAFSLSHPTVAWTCVKIKTRTHKNIVSWLQLIEPANNVMQICNAMHLKCKTLGIHTQIYTRNTCFFCSQT